MGAFGKIDRRWNKGSLFCLSVLFTMYACELLYVYIYVYVCAHVHLQTRHVISFDSAVLMLPFALSFRFCMDDVFVETVRCS